MANITTKILMPVEAPVSCPFGHVSPGLRDDKPHAGVDFACKVGEVAKAAFDGKVVLIKTLEEGTEREKRFGNRLGLLSADLDVYAIYAHLSEFLVPLGAIVKAETPLAKTGNTGNSTGPHLHFETRDQNGLAFNPFPQLSS